jgi:hypothetical protein
MFLPYIATIEITRFKQLKYLIMVPFLKNSTKFIHTYKSNHATSDILRHTRFIKVTYHHHQPIYVLTAGAQAHLIDYT